jgi:pyridoxal phosphate enzyme (YggS family)
MKYIENNLKNIKDRISLIRKEYSIEREITIVAVSKTFTPLHIKAVCESGIKNIGENRYQEAKPKIDELSGLGIIWHFIGTLQTNKIRKIMESFDLIQSVGEIKHIDKIDSIAKEKGVVYPVFIEINIGKEENKAGFPVDDIEYIINHIKEKQNIVLKGMMCIPPYSPNPEDSRKYFIKMKKIYDEAEKMNNGKNIRLEELSMGMSEDYLIAIEEGATMVRIGRGIFGKRG